MWLPRTSPHPSTFKTITLVHLLKNEILSGLETAVGEVHLRCLTLVSELHQAHSSTAFESISKALSHNRAETYLKMFRLIDKKCRKPQMGARCQQTRNVCKCVYQTPTASALLAISTVCARIYDKQQNPPRRAGEGGREREKKSEPERKKLPNYASVYAKHLLPALRSQLAQCAPTLRSDRFVLLAFVDRRNPKGGCTPA